ncbi:MAG: hypothetical protein ACK4OO_06150, partial [bacterium]
MNLLKDRVRIRGLIAQSLLCGLIEISLPLLMGNVFAVSLIQIKGEVYGSFQIGRGDNRLERVFSSLSENLDEQMQIYEVSREPLGEGQRLIYQQTFRGYPVLGARAVVWCSFQDEIFSLYTTLTSFSPPDGLGPRISEEEALQVALSAMGIKSVRASPSLYPAVLVIDGVGRWVWVVELPASDLLGDWEVLIDGIQGEVFQVEDLLEYNSIPGWVFDPDPKSSLGVDTLEDRNDAAEAIPQEAYLEVNLSPLYTDEEGFYILKNEFVDLTPSPQAARMERPDFRFLRNDLRFEQVMGYYNITQFARYVENLGFEGLPPQPIEVCANGIEEDLSFYSPLIRRITTGRGGVDDGEDGDVWAHEYTHALIHRILPRWRGGEKAILTEGTCDYFAGDWSQVKAPHFQPDWIYNWDGHNQFWDGRVLNAPYRYPQDANREPHDAGQIWSGLLTEVARQSDMRDLWNRIIFHQLHLLGDSVLLPQAAVALL